MTISIDIADAVWHEVEQVFREQAARLGPDAPASIPRTAVDWLRQLLEQQVAALVGGRLQTPEVVQARAALETTQQALIRTVAGIRTITVR